MPRICNRCHIEKSINEFGIGGASNGYRQPYCYDCAPSVQAPYKARYRKEKARKKINDLQLQGQLFFMNAGAY